MISGLREECGVLGLYAPEEQAARLGVFGLHALQHRGQESAGMASSDGAMAYIFKAMGLVTQIFNEKELVDLPGEFAIGHTRYSTTGASRVSNAQPFLIETAIGAVGIAHNGNLTNAPILRKKLLDQGVALSTSSDTELIVHMISRGKGGMISRIRSVMQHLEGAYCLAIMTKDAVYGVRDQWGYRPLCIGTLPNGGGALASESCALGAMGAEFLDEVGPGEIVRFDQNGLHREQGAFPRRQSMCSFEHIYFARPDSVFGGRSVHSIRQQFGRRLARENPIDADIVIAVPDSGIPAAIGYAEESGMPYSEGLTKNRYIARTFIQPTAEQRRNAVRMKFNPLPENLKDKRVVVIDDSIVRGTTMGPLIKMLRGAGAKEVHIRISSPPLKFGCYMGVDMSDDNLIAAKMTVDEICAKIGSDSLAYLSLEGLMEELDDGGPPAYCGGCFNGCYAVNIPHNVGKMGLSGALG